MKVLKIFFIITFIHINVYSAFGKRGKENLRGKGKPKGAKCHTWGKEGGRKDGKRPPHHQFNSTKPIWSCDDENDCPKHNWTEERPFWPCHDHENCPKHNWTEGNWTAGNWTDGKPYWPCDGEEDCLSHNWTTGRPFWSCDDEEDCEKYNWTDGKPYWLCDDEQDNSTSTRSNANVEPSSASISSFEKATITTVATIWILAFVVF